MFLFFEEAVDVYAVLLDFMRYPDFFFISGLMKVVLCASVSVASCDCGSGIDYTEDCWVERRGVMDGSGSRDSFNSRKLWRRAGNQSRVDSMAKEFTVPYVEFLELEDTALGYMMA